MSLPSMTPSFENLFAFSMSKTTKILVSLTTNNVIRFAIYLINISLTILLINRWLISGHFPLSNLYESLIFLSWSFSTIYSVTSFTLRGEARTTLIPIISWCVAPITLLTCGYAFFCVPQQLQKAESLVPALQSNWLIMHVSVMILSYASLILGSLFAFSLLLIVNLELVYPLLFVTRDEKMNFRFNLPTVNLSKISVDSTAGKSSTTRLASLEQRASPYRRSEALSIVEVVKLKNSPIFGWSLKSTNFIKKIKDFKNKVKQSATKNNSFLDNLSYRFIGLGFALLTLGIISGAVWANSAWGSYWSWDPKETWAFITWLTYAIYLHLRISKGWYGKQSAFVAVFGFFVVWFCYLGVNLFGKGLHSYAFV